MGGKGGCALWSLGWGSLRWWGGAPINTAKLSSEETQDFTSFSNLLALSFSLLQIRRNGYFPAAMRGHFSIEWMAQSSQSAGTDTLPGPVACGTHSESLPGFYCRQKLGKLPEESRNQGLKTLSQHQISHNDQGKSRLVQNTCNTHSIKDSFTVDVNTFSRYKCQYSYFGAKEMNNVDKMLNEDISTSNTHTSLLFSCYCRCYNTEPFSKCDIRWLITNYSFGCAGVWKVTVVCLYLAAATEVGFGSGTEEETSGYESEGDHSRSPSAPAESSAAASSPPSPTSGRRPRTAFTAEQICSMERAFKRNAYLGTQDKAELCKKLNLSDKQVKIWVFFLLDYLLFQKKCSRPVWKCSFMDFYQLFRSETGSRTGGWSWRGRCRTRWLMPVRQTLSLSSCITPSCRPTDRGPTPGSPLRQQSLHLRAQLLPPSSTHTACSTAQPCPAGPLWL